MDIHEESHTVLDFRFEQGNFLLVTGSSLHLGIRHNDLCEGRSGLCHIHGIVLIEQRQILQQIRMIRMSKLMGQCRHIGRSSAVGHKNA
ncbi:hypothetical protein D3C75_1117430 [compost metagenome]